jgi:hypothetical protein
MKKLWLAMMLAGCTSQDNCWTTDMSPNDLSTGAADMAKEISTVDMAKAIISSDMNVSSQDMVSGSSSRIMRKYNNVDGQKQFLSWYDTKLKTDCSFYTMSDGNQHCILLRVIIF